MIKDFKFFIFRLAIIGLITLLIISFYMFFNQKNFIYFPDSRDFGSCPGFADSEKVEVAGTRMYYLEARDPVTILVYYHGNAGSACDRAFVKDILKDRGLSLLFVEYAGYSGDTRDPSKDLILQDAENADKFISGVGYEKVVLMGTSLGTAVAAYHQTLRYPEKMILLAPFDKLSHVGKIHYPFLPVSLLLREEYDTAGWLKDYEGEVVIIHGIEDEIVPVELAKELYESIPSNKKTFITIKDTDHNTLLGRSEVWEKVITFLNPEDK